MEQVYQIFSLKPDVVLIRWLQSPVRDSVDERGFIDALLQKLNEADGAIYFISDLRRGRITGRSALQQLSQLTEHPNWGGSSGFSQDPVSLIYAGVFEKFAEASGERNRVFQQPEEALAFLEFLKPGISDDIDWRSLIVDPSAAS